MKADLLSLLTAKSMNYEISSGNHDAVTPEDIAHFLGTRDLDSAEFELLLAKYTDDSHSRSMLFDYIYEDCCSIFLKYLKPKQLSQDKFLMHNYINLALREVLYPNCPFCQGRGTIITGSSITKCQHCEGSGQFIYNDDNRPQFLGYKKQEFMALKKPYIEMLEMVKNIEINALSKIGDE